MECKTHQDVYIISEWYSKRKFEKCVGNFWNIPRNQIFTLKTGKEMV